MMKPTISLILVVLTVATIIGMVTVSVQQVSAPRTCAGCIAFKKLTHEFEKDVIQASKYMAIPDSIPGFLEQYNQAVLNLFVRGG